MAGGRFGLNESEGGAPLQTGYTPLFGAKLWGHNTLLPGPYHYLPASGTIRVGSYPIVPTINPQEMESYGGDAPLRLSPAYKRLDPWMR